jgi:hypothetical protein
MRMIDDPAEFGWRPTKSGRERYLPSPTEIAAQCAEIQTTWTPADFKARIHWSPTRPKWADAELDETTGAEPDAAARD